MSDIKARHVEMIEKEIAEHRAAISALEGLLAAIQSYEPGVSTANARSSQHGAAATPRTNKPAPKGRPTKAKTRARKPAQDTYVLLAEEALRAAGAPMRMMDILAKILPLRPGAGKYADSAARQAITKVVDTGESRIARAGPKGSGLLTLRDGKRRSPSANGPEPSTGGAVAEEGATGQDPGTSSPALPDDGISASADMDSTGAPPRRKARPKELTTKSIADHYRALADQAVSDFDGRIRVDGGPREYYVYVADFPPIVVTRGELLECPPFDTEPDDDADRKRFNQDVSIQQVAGLLSGTRLVLGLGQARPQRFFTPR